MKILLIDNYDSFTYNLYHLVEKSANISTQIDVIRNNQLTLDQVKPYNKIIISPGPGLPSEAGLTKEIIKQYASSKNILGICLGLQAIAEVFQSPLKNLNTVIHGEAHDIQITNYDTIFKKIPSTIKVARYHSWVIDEEKISQELYVDAICKTDNTIMAIHHKQYNIYGLQFHPESILSEYGETMIKNWLNL